MVNFLKPILCTVFVFALILIPASFLSTKRHFYNYMCKMPIESSWCMGDYIPDPLSGLEETYTGPILEFRKDTLSITQRFPTPADEKNRYIVYVLKDNHGRVWSIVREPDMKYEFYMYRNE